MINHLPADIAIYTRVISSDARLTDMDTDNAATEPISIRYISWTKSKITDENKSRHVTYNPLVIPPGVVEIIFRTGFNEIIGKGVFPAGLKKIRFEGDFNKMIGAKVIPNSVTYIYFGGKYNQIIRRKVLPSSLKKLCFCGNFNREIKNGVLPKGLEILTFCGKYNRELNSSFLPFGLKHLGLCGNFDKGLNNNDLPKGLRSIMFGTKYSQPIGDGILPDSLETVTICNENTDCSTLDIPDSARLIISDRHISHRKYTCLAYLKSAIELLETIPDNAKIERIYKYRGLRAIDVDPSSI